MRVNSLNGRSILSVNDMSADEFESIIDLSIRIKKSIRAGLFSLEREGRIVTLLFQKPSTRTRLSVEVAARMLKAHPIYLGSSETQLSRGEPMSDTVRVIERMSNCIVARVNSHTDLMAMRRLCRIPVINALSDFEHPLQALADYMTLKEKKGTLRGLKVAYVGDGNNVANSLILGAAKLGVFINVATPDNYRPSLEILATAKVEAEKTGARIDVVSSPQRAVEDADAVYTDVWVSMGQEDERTKKVEALRPYQVNSALMRLAKPDAVFMHCLPAHRGEEVTEDVFESPSSVVFEQAENRLHTAIATLYSVL
jgi:ornithine carbamoyltransferase